MAAALSVLTAPHAAAQAPPDVVSQWNDAALRAIRSSRTAPPLASRALALLHTSIYDAVNGIVRTHAPYLVQSSAPASAVREAAASAAARLVLGAIFPARAGEFDALHDAILSGIPGGPRKAAGIAWGEFVATGILTRRAADNSDVPVAPPGQTGPGFWVPTPPAFAEYLLPQWGSVEPFAVPTGAAMRPPGPPSLGSAKWAAEYNEVKNLGAAEGSVRTSEQELIALFWADGAGTETPPGHWNTIARRVVADRRGTLEESARLFALLNIAMADAAICAWDAKYAYDFWRPVTAIRNGDTDGNPDTEPDPVWSSLIATPPFPEYVSGHSAFSGAAATVLAMFYGTDRVAFTIGSDGAPGVSRHFASFSAAATEAAVSRLYGGIHFRSGIEDGLVAGVEIGQWTYQHTLAPKGNHSRK